MFFPVKQRKADSNEGRIKIQLLEKKKLSGKEKYVLPAGENRHIGERISASMTLEASCVMPLFLFAMLAILQFAKIEIISSALLAGMQDTAKDMAAYAYVRQLGISAEEGIAADLLSGGISAAYAKNSVAKKANLKSSDGSISLWKSNFVQDEMIDLAITYEAKNTYTILPIPNVKASLRARVRAWTGRDGNGAGTAGSEGEAGEREETVYVTTTGSVYHKNENCTHIKLSIQTVSRENAEHLRNKSGGKYHACERCGGGTGDSVYITDYGDRYHSSLGCSGLKRSVLKVPISQVEDWRACSKCGGS